MSATFISGSRVELIACQTTPGTAVQISSDWADRAAEYLGNARRLLFIVNDETRATPTAAALSALAPLWRNRDKTLLVATGSHKGPDETGLRYILGPHYAELSPHCRIHRCHEPHKNLGTTNRGTPVLLDPLVFEHDALVVIGSVEPHYFAGWTGGRKALMPGVAAYESIRANHRWAMEATANPMVLSGNPVHEDMAEFATFVERPIFSLQAVVDPSNITCGWFDGSLKNSFAAAADFARPLFGVTLTEPADILVSQATPPLDADFYQALKAVENTASVVKDGGVLILVATCRQGLGLDRFYNTLAARIKVTAENYQLGDHKAHRLAALSKRVHLAVVSELDPALLHAINLHPFYTLEQALNWAADLTGKSTGVYIPNGSVTIPQITTV